MNNSIELLSPVGSMEALFAAVENGANAVYLGGKLFNARQYASNFDYAELKAAVEYAHLRNVKVYVTVNILLEDKELEEVIDYLIFLYNIDVDAVIIQDLGLYEIIKDILPDFEVHGSTQMSINNHMGVKFLEELGFQRVVLARELSIDEIKFISENTDIELEGFIHGALCVSYSGQCLMSSLIGGRSGNRGTCAQPCRMSYSIVNIKSGQVINDRFNEKYILSTKDLNTIEHIEEIIDAGVTSFKIEGRMKKPEYVAIIVNKYRKALDNIKGDNRYALKSRDIKDMAQMFNRGFTKGYIMNDFGGDFISFDKPNNRGVSIGKVIKTDKSYTYIQLDDSLSKGDGVEIVNNNGDSYGAIIDFMYIDDKKVEQGFSQDIVKIKNIRGVSRGASVNKTFDIKLNEAAKETFTKNKNKLSINMSIKVEIDKPIELTIWEQSSRVTVKSDELAEKGIKMSLNENKVRSQMEKLGDTPYLLSGIEIKLDENVMAPMSVLNKLRRKGIEELNKKRGNFNKRVEINRNDLVSKIDQVFDFPGNQVKDSNKISVKVSNIEQFNQLDINKLDRAYLGFTGGLEECIKQLKSHNKEVYIATERIIGNDEFDGLSRVLDRNVSDVDGISISNIGTLKFVKDRYDKKIHCDNGMNLFNSFAIKLLSNYGIESLTLSSELTLGQISNICGNNNIIHEAIGYGYLPVMLTKHCPLSLVKGCKDSSGCSTCKFNSGFGLFDRKGMTFEIARKGKTTTIYNSQPLMIPDYIDKLYSNNVNMVRLDFTVEKEIRDIQTVYYDYANKIIDKDEVLNFLDYYKQKVAITKGHYFRGVI
ncbi:DUF3656 domain-containing U32 family peptidase [Brassicibacter mesophilus]|uniref:DUF3656 domain-containing U32 family peptidase n=1 Tax=Brassicibacter mesophilus TaxID=745119 RepID=UPI003D252CB0